MNTGAWLRGFFQLGYVTPDLDAAVAAYRDRLGVARFLTFDSRDFTGQPELESYVRVGLAWTGETMIELIEPVGDHPLYASAMPKGGSGVQLHHLGYLAPDEAGWEAALAWAGQAGFPIAVRSPPSPMLEYAYVDARSGVGHYLEIVWAKPEGLAWFDTVPRN